MASPKTSIQMSLAMSSQEFIVSHRGTPLGRTHAYVLEGALILGEPRAAPGYDAIRDLIRQASASLWAVGFLAKSLPAITPVVPADAVTRAAELPLELHDATGTLVWTDFVNIVEPRAPRFGLPRYHA